MQISIFNHTSPAAQFYSAAVAKLIRESAKDGILSEMSGSNGKYRIHNIQDPGHGLQIIVGIDGLKRLTDVDFNAQPYADIHTYGLCQRDTPIYRELNDPMLLDTLNELMDIMATVANIVPTKYREGLSPVGMELIEVPVGGNYRSDVPITLLSITYGNRAINLPNAIAGVLRPAFVFVQGK